MFDNNGDAQHIHSVIMKEFPVLTMCGGYTLLRLAENSHNMVVIEGPDNGMTVRYLKDILNYAKLYIRPLQKDITMKPYSTPQVRLEDYYFGLIFLQIAIELAIYSY